MKNIVCLMVILFFLSCQTEKKQVVYQKKIERFTPSDSFNGIIDDFENNLVFWKENNAKIITQRENNNHICIFKFKAAFSPELSEDSISSIRYNRKMNFQRYKGIKFSAKSDYSDILFKMRVYEKENYFKNKRTNEIWYKSFKVTPAWLEYRVSFKDMRVEEYYEQDYISDGIQIFSEILGIEISAHNLAKNDTIDGELYLDNIMLY